MIYDDADLKLMAFHIKSLFDASEINKCILHIIRVPSSQVRVRLHQINSKMKTIVMALYFVGVAVILDAKVVNELPNGGSLLSPDGKYITGKEHLVASNCYFKKSEKILILTFDS